jgi:MFS family permease
MKHSNSAAWVVILAGVVAALQVGKLPPALPVLQAELGVSWVQSGFLLSMVQFAGMALGLVLGLLADRWGLRLCMVLGLGILAVASGSGGWARSPQDLMWLRGLEGLGFLLSALPAPALIRQLVSPTQLNGMLGVWGAYMPAGTALALLAGPMWIPAWGWPSWWWLFAVASAVMALGLWWVVPPDALRRRQAMAALPVTDLQAPSKEASGAGWGQRIQDTLRAPGPWLVSLTFALYSGQWLAVVGFLPSIYAQAGVAGAGLGALTALAAGVNMLGNVAAGRWLQKGVAPGVLLNLGFAAMALGSALAFGDWTQALPLARYAWVLLISMCGGLVPGTLFSLAVRLSPHEGTVSTTVGWMQQWSCVGQFAGPPLVAWLASSVGGWQWTWLITGACCLGGMTLARQMTSVLSRTIRATPVSVNSKSRDAA